MIIDALKSGFRPSYIHIDNSTAGDASLTKEIIEDRFLFLPICGKIDLVTDVNAANRRIKLSFKNGNKTIWTIEPITDLTASLTWSIRFSVNSEYFIHGQIIHYGIPQFVFDQTDSLVVDITTVQVGDVLNGGYLHGLAMRI